MTDLIRSELIKGKRTFSRRSTLIFTLLVTFLAIFLTGGRLTQVGAFNWWYGLLLPVLLALLCGNIIDSEKRFGFFNIHILPVSGKRVWTAKTAAVIFCIFAANLFLFGFTTIGGFVFGVNNPAWVGIVTVLILTWTTAWQIPLGMFLAARVHSSAALAVLLVFNVICASQPVAGGRFWFIPFAIPARLMAPVIGVNPNGVMLEAGSPLWNTNVMIPGLAITFILFIILLAATGRWFQKRGETDEKSDK